MTVLAHSIISLSISIDCVFPPQHKRWKHLIVQMFPSSPHPSQFSSILVGPTLRCLLSNIKQCPWQIIRMYGHQRGAAWDGLFFWHGGSVGTREGDPNPLPFHVSGGLHRLCCSKLGNDHIIPKRTTNIYRNLDPDPVFLRWGHLYLLPFSCGASESLIQAVGKITMVERSNPLKYLKLTSSSI